ncbi:MAG TPA: hypothetical protein VGL72_17990 [Bryobacteraceae bacterium]|jgi:hypothetical protein
MSTKAQIAANRANAQRSTGPRTDDGKARTRQNALRHGLCSAIPTMSDETSEEIQTLLETLREEHEPVGATEEILVYKMAEHFFFGKRAGYLLTQELDSADSGSGNNSKLSLLLRYHTTADRGYHKALAELRKLQGERRLEEIGFVSQNAQSVPEAPPAEHPDPESVRSQPDQSAAPTPRRLASPIADALPGLLQMTAGDPELTDIVLQFFEEAA